MNLLRQFPVIVILLLATAVAMMVPSLHAARLEDWLVARTFLYHSLFFIIIGMMLGLGTMGHKHRLSSRYQLFSLVGAYFLLPLAMALPVNHLVPSISYAQSYFEMLSSLTTTGATILPDPDRVAEPIHLWRAVVGWAGGFMTLFAALAILEPMKLGGFEIEATVAGHKQAVLHRGTISHSVLENRFENLLRSLIPIYVLVTACAAILLMVLGDRAFVAVCHAMSVVATSGITPLSDLSETGSGYAGEGLLLLFLLLALSRKGFADLQRQTILKANLNDPELKLALACILVIPSLLVLRHFLGAVEVDDQQNLGGALTAFWGSLFTTTSYLSTFGLESRDWAAAQGWSGLSTPGVILLGLCIMGGGVATTAGGIKLLRVYALYKHGVREMRRLIHPSSVGGAGMTARRIRREGAYIAWIFLMLFTLSIALTMTLLSLLGNGFEDALAFSVATLTNTGPAASVLGSANTYGMLSTTELAVLSVAMVVGRLEILVFVALLNPFLWGD